MEEKRRFAVALAGVAGCLCLAAGIVFSGHGDAVAPLVESPLPVGVQVLPRSPTPSWAELPGPRPEPPASTRPRDLVMASRMGHPASPEAATESTPLELAPQPEQQPLRALSTRRLAISMLVRTAPDAAGTDVLVAQEHTRRHGPVTGALLTAGTHVGGGFKTVGRTLRRVF